MRICALAFAATTLALGAPVQAMEHKATIDHPVGQIAADYSGTTKVAMQQVGTAGVGGRQDSLRCHWSVSLVVERQARLGEGPEARHTLARSNVVKGSAPGWCPQQGHLAERIAARHRDDLHAAMMALVEQDRALILAEADRMRGAPRES
ncbi:hypothetical protein NSE01_03410 [Novosphingobium sediminis]|uniref:Uncharacterized protein n=1 Tax=Novosphingobium sediminis TaxID=707214 RepID=A0A512AFN8_9SPHN|nr:hypothetical protein [Novosphingobium sediminis]GEN98508.1 hypothetical protein NSE01_03410 [Novosphingobium sediminis]